MRGIPALPCLTMGLVLLATPTVTGQSTYVVGGPGRSLSPTSPGAWDDPTMNGLRQALRDPTNFGMSGVVPVRVTPMDLAVIDYDSLDDLDCFAAAGWADADMSAAQLQEVLEFFTRVVTCCSSATLRWRTGSPTSAGCR